MRQVNLKPIVIFSASHSYINNDRLAVDFMDKLDIAFKQVQGVYTYNNGEIVTETSFLVSAKDFDSHLKTLVFGRTFSQESILRLDNERSATLDYGEYIEDLGQFVSTTKAIAEANKAYTYDSTTNTYYICRKIGA